MALIGTELHQVSETQEISVDDSQKDHILEEIEKKNSKTL
jgi:hypothetical protein